MQFRDFTKNEIDAAYQLKLSGFLWEWEIGDFFTPDSKSVHIAMSQEGEGAEACIVNRDGEKFLLKKVVWLLKWSQCVQWFIAHGLPKVNVETLPKYSKVEVQGKEVGPVMGMGGTDIEAAYETMAEILNLRQGGFL